MKFLIILCCLVAAKARVVKRCQGVSIEGHLFKKEVLLSNFDRPYLLDVNKDTNDLYFSYSLDENDTDSQTVRLNLDSKKYYRISDIVGANTQVVDQATGDVYIGTHDSIYKYKPKETPTKAVNDLDNNWVSDMAFNDGTLYYVTYPEEKIYSYKQGNALHLPEFDGLVISYIVVSYNAFFFSNNTGIYRKLNNEIELLKSVSKAEVRGLAIDNTGRMYASLFDGLYVFVEDTVSMKKILDVPSSYGVTFDRANNMIYSTETALVRLLPINESQCNFEYK